MPSTNTKAIFLHGLWRCGSTYVWTKFRSHNETYCYYEPLQHGLAKLTEERIERVTPKDNDADNHPDTETPKLEEFRPLLQGRGPKGYHRAFCDHSYFLHNKSKSPKLKNYIKNLIDHAEQEGRRPVLGFNRSCLRSGWLNHNFSAYNLHIDRDPIELWHSYHRLLQKGNRTFFSAWMQMVEHNAKSPVFAPLAQEIPLRSGVQKYTSKAKRFYHKALENMSNEETYFMVYYLWAVCTLHSLSYAQDVLDMSRVTEGDYTKHISETISANCGLPLDFSDAQRKPLSPKDIIPTHQDIEARVKDLLSSEIISAIQNPQQVQKHIHTLDERKASLLSSLISQ